jgi:hypothetical protein
LSLSTAVRIVDVLVNVDFFDEDDLSNHFAIELHLRCVISALRVLTTFGSYNIASYLTYEIVERLYNTLAMWSQMVGLHEQKAVRSNVRAHLETYDAEYLLVYTRDLAASISTDRDLMVQAVVKLAGGVSPRTSVNISLLHD